MIKLHLQPLVPPLWAKTGHIQTILGHLIPSKLFKEPGEKVEITLEDGDKITGRLIEGHTNTVIYLFHGLGGSIDADYMHRTAKVCHDMGHTVLMMNHRGCGDGAKLAKNPYHSGRAEDLSTVIDYGRTRYPAKSHLAIGFSLSGNALLLLLSGRRGSVKPDFAVSVNAPINLERASRSLSIGINRVYDIRFVQQCRRELRLRGASEYKIPILSTLYDFDEIYTGRAGGFRDRNDYYETCSTQGLLSEIKIPTIILTAKDDPFVHFEDYARAKLSWSVYMHAEDIGGHMGYLTNKKTPLGTTRWLDYAVSECVRAFIT